MIVILGTNSLRFLPSSYLLLRIPSRSWPLFGLPPSRLSLKVPPLGTPSAHQNPFANDPECFPSPPCHLLKVTLDLPLLTQAYVFPFTPPPTDPLPYALCKSCLTTSRCHSLFIFAFFTASLLHLPVFLFSLFVFLCIPVIHIDVRFIYMILSLLGRTPTAIHVLTFPYPSSISTVPLPSCGVTCLYLLPDGLYLLLRAQCYNHQLGPPPPIPLPLPICLFLTDCYFSMGLFPQRLPL